MAIYLIDLIDYLKSRDNWVTFSTFFRNNQKISNYLKLESVTPILDPNLISYATHLPHIYKYDSKLNIGKLPLRKLLDKFNATSLISNQKL